MQPIADPYLQKRESWQKIPHGGRDKILSEIAQHSDEGLLVGCTCPLLLVVHYQMTICHDAQSVDILQQQQQKKYF